MRFSDFFVPKYLHSNPNVRIKFINRTTDLKCAKAWDPFMAMKFKN